MDSPIARRVAGLFVLALWGVSLALPVFTTCRTGYDHVAGWFLLAFGWMGFMAGMPAWLANIFVPISALILAVGNRVPMWVGIVGGGLAATALFWKSWVDDTGNVPICHYHPGYWVWLAAAAIVLLVSILDRRSTTQ